MILTFIRDGLCEEIVRDINTFYQDPSYSVDAKLRFCKSVLSFVQEVSLNENERFSFSETLGNKSK